MSKTFGERIRELRTQHGLTQAALGDLLGVSGDAIWQIEAKTEWKPRQTTIQRYADAFGISPMELLQGVSFENKNGTAPAKPFMESARTTVALAEYEKGREGRHVALYQSPQEFERVVQVWLKPQNGSYFKIPLWSDMRICVGPDIPKWHVEQEVNRGIAAIRVVLANGKAEEFQVNPSFPITIAPQEV